MPTSNIFLVAAPGLEELCAKEAAQLGNAAPRVVPGGVEIDSADSSTVECANLYLRLPTRVLLRLGEVEARDFKKLRRGVAQLPWRTLLPVGARIAIRASASRCRLYHTGAITEQIALALADDIGAVVATDEDATFSVLARGLRDHFTLSLDTSGERLHRRGWRTEGGAAPLRETLAGALLAIAAHAPDEPLVDPMCGSGTIVLEAALRAIGRAPGLDRRFAFEHFVGHDAARWKALRDEARARERPRPLSLLGSDADPAQVEAARSNAVEAGVAELVRFEVAKLSSVRAPAARGLFITNAPYGKRVSAHDGNASALYADLAAALRGSFSGWRAAVLVGDRAILPRMGLDGRQAIPLMNGGLRVWVGRRG